MSAALWWILIPGALFGVGLVVYNIWFVEEEDEDEEGEGYDGGATMVDGARADTLGETLLSTASEERAARKSRMLALKDSLERSLESREGEGAEAKDRMSMPWFLLIGSGGSGKTTMLANTGLPLPYGPAFEVDNRKRDAGRWWLFEDAVVLEAPAASGAVAASSTTLSPGQKAAGDTSEGWNTLLHMLRRERPDSPLNGIVVTVSCADLVAGGRDSEKLAEQAERIRSFLERTRKVLEVRLPLHILVTKCDTLPGFRSFADNLPTSRRNDIFGWANPAKLETPFNPSWVDQGCEVLKKELEDLRDEVLAAPDEIKDADGLFVFVSEFGNLQEPLRDFVSRLYTEGETRPPLFFRGMYFCGDAIDPSLQKTFEDEQIASGKSRATMQLSAEVALTGTMSSHNLVFLKHLFTHKIFKEAGLARPVARFRLSRDRRVVVAQAAAALIAVVGSTGLWTTVNGFQRGDSVVQRGLRADAEALAHALAGMAIDLDDLRRGRAGTPDVLTDRRAQDAAVVELVDEMRALHTIKRSPFIPASWFSPLPDQVKQSMEAGIQDIVLPVIRERLEERAAALLDTAGESASGGSVMTNPRALAEYLSEVRVLSQQITQYNKLAAAGAGGVAELAALLDYLFDVQLDDVGLASEDFQNALSAAKADRISLANEVAATVVRRSMHLVSTLGAEAGNQLAKPANAQAELAIQPEDDLRALRQLATLVELSDARRGVVASMNEVRRGGAAGADGSILGADLARLVQDSIRSQIRGAALRMSGDSGAAELQTQRLRRVIDTLFATRLMDPVEEREIVADFPPTQRLRWDVGSLELAIAMRQERDKAVANVNTTMPGQTPDRLRRAFDVQLRARVLGVVAGAQRLTVISSGSIPTADVRYGAGNLNDAAPRLVRLATLLDTLKAGAEGRRLIAAVTRQAEQVMGTAQAILDNDNALVPKPDKVAAWQGVVPISWAALEVGDSVRLEAARLGFEQLVRPLTTDVEPAVRFLARVPPNDNRVPRLLAEWTALIGNMQRYDRADTSSTVWALRRYLSNQMSAQDMASCVGAVAPDTSRPSPDPFVRRRRMFQASLNARCGNEGSVATATYERLRVAFMTRIAGRYPFVDSTQAQTAGDVDPVMLKDFLTQYDAFMSGPYMALRSDPSLLGASGGAWQFLAQMAPVRAFFAPLMDAGDRRPPEYTIAVEAVDSVTDRELMVAAKTVAVDAAAHDFAWRLGDPIRLTRRDSGQVRPVFTSRGTWAVVQLPRQQPVRLFHPYSKAELFLPGAFPVLAPEIVRPGAAPKPLAPN